jgi:hypothetical protein
MKFEVLDVLISGLEAYPIDWTSLSRLEDKYIAIFNFKNMENF